MVTRNSKLKLSKRTASPPRKRKSPQSKPVGPAFEKLVAVMARLRAPNGCPWDREQTHTTLRTYLIEEAYEVLDALDSTDDAKFAEELGDLLLQVLFHAQIAGEEHRFNITDVINEIYSKMIRRHPHVFGDKRAKDSAGVLRNWEQIKKQERTKAAGKHVSGSPGPSARHLPPTSEGGDQSDSFLDGVPRTLPALLEALQLTRKAARIGFDWHNLEGIFSKLDEETHELRQALTSISRQARKDGTENRSFGSDNNAPGQEDAAASEVLNSPARFSSASTVESEVGDILFVAVNLARFLDLDPELALKKTNAKFSRRFREMERLARQQGTTLAQVTRPQMEQLWDQAKLSEQSRLSTVTPLHKNT